LLEWPPMICTWYNMMCAQLSYMNSWMRKSSWNNQRGTRRMRCWCAYSSEASMAWSRQQGSGITNLIIFSLDIIWWQTMPNTCVYQNNGHIEIMIRLFVDDGINCSINETKLTYMLQYLWKHFKVNKQLLCWVWITSLLQQPKYVHQSIMVHY
jgi:hypothetical protein